MKIVQDRLALQDVAYRDFRVENDLLFHKEQLYAPHDLRTQCMEGAHNTPIARHLGSDKTFSVL